MEAEKRKLSQARVADLRADLEKRGLDKNGVKAVLVERLVAALTSEGLSSSEIDEYVVESGTESPKKPAKRGVTPSKNKDDDELLADLDNKSEVLDYGDNDDLEVGNSKEDELLECDPIDDGDKNEDEEEKMEEDEEKIEEEDTAEKEVQPQNSKVEAESAKSTQDDEFEVLDEEASDAGEESKDGQQQESNVDNEDSIHLTLNEDEEKLLIEEEETGFSTESDAPAAQTRVQKKPQQNKHLVSGSSSSSSVSGTGGSGNAKKLAPSNEAAKSDKNQDSGSAGEANASTGEKKKVAGSPKGTERVRISVDEKHSVSTSQQKSSEQQQEGQSGDKSRSNGAPKENKDNSSESSDNKRETSPSGSNSSGRNLWVSGLSSTTRATDLKQTFSKHGKVLGAKVVTNTRTPGARCYGFVTMAKKEDAQRCIQHLDRTELHGRMISVEKAKGEANGPGRVKTPPSPLSAGADKKSEEEHEGQKKESGKPSDASKDLRRDIREKLNANKSVRQRITAPSPGPAPVVAPKGPPSDRSDSRSGQRSAEPPLKKRQRTRSPLRTVPPPRRVNHSPGGGLHTRRSATAVLTFASIKAPPVQQARERQRLREREREDREHARRREEEARRLERRQKEEQLRIEREKEELRLERERIERARKDILRLEREKARLERERLEWEREELRRQQQKLRELAERPPIVTAHLGSAVAPSRSGWNSSSFPPASETRYEDVRRSSSSSATKRHGDHHSSNYFEERAAKRPVASSGDDRRAYDSSPAAPPPPRFSTSSTAVVKRPSERGRDIDFPHRSSSGPFERAPVAPVSSSSSYDRVSSSGRRDNYYSSSSSANGTRVLDRVIEPTRREPDSDSRGKDDRYRDSYRSSVRGSDRSLGGRDAGGIESRGPAPVTGLSGSSSARQRDRYPEPVGRGVVPSSASSREPWLDRKNETSGSSWPRSSETTSSDRWSSSNIGISNSRSGGIFNSTVPSLGLGLQLGGAPTSSSLFSTGDRYDAYKTPISSLRKY